MNLYESIKNNSNTSIENLLQGIVDEVILEFEKHNTNFRYDYYISPNNKQIEVVVDWGDWKHDHRLLDNTFNTVFSRNGIPYEVNVEVTDEDGSDTYSATHTYTVTHIPKIRQESIVEGDGEKEYKRIILTDDHDTSLSPANIVVTGDDGTAGCLDYLDKLISNCNSAEELAQKLNDNKFPTAGDKRIFGTWNPVKTESNVTKRICTNMFLNKFNTIKYGKVLIVDSNSDGHQILKLYKDGIILD